MTEGQLSPKNNHIQYLREIEGTTLTHGNVIAEVLSS
jgi:hypothetical protein